MVNEHLGYVPPQAVVEMADLLGLAPAQVQDTLSFYRFFPQDRPVGTLPRLGVPLDQLLRRGRRITAGLSGRAARYPPGRDDPRRPGDADSAECLGVCEFAPAMLVNETLHKDLTREKIDAFVEMVKAS